MFHRAVTKIILPSIKLKCHTTWIDGLLCLSSETMLYIMKQAQGESSLTTFLTLCEFFITYITKWQKTMVL